MLGAGCLLADTTGQFEELSWFEHQPIGDDFFSSLVSVSFSAFDPFAPLRSQIARALSQAMSQSGKSREQIAMDMSEFLSAETTKNMLDAYASPSRDEHRIPIDSFIALIFATEGFGLLGFVAEQFGFVVVPEKYSALIKLHLIDEQMERQSQRKAALLGKWKAGR